MSAKLIGNNADGANYQAQAVLAMVRYGLGDGIESSWDSDLKRYRAEPEVARFDNCREQGYVIYMRDRAFKEQINIAFYEHRNSDQIYVQINNERTLNAPTCEQITKRMVDKWSCAHQVSVGEIEKAADFIVKALAEFWNKDAAK